jgi:hypothetical protein
MSFRFFLENVNLEYHQTLNPALWEPNQVLKDDARQALLRFADAWAKFVKIPKDLIQDIYMVGGNCNYNYTSQSDIDVHLIVDTRLLGIASDFLEDYLKTKKSLWLSQHHIKVKGYDVEPYVQAPSEHPPANQGVYSLKTNSWVIVPVHGNYDFQNDKALEHKVNFYKHRIDRVVGHNGSLDVAKSLKDELQAMRSAGLEKAGEFSFENNVFKATRNDGYLDRLKNYIEQTQDHSLSLD